MSFATAFVHELFEGVRHHRHHAVPPRTVPAARDWDDWFHYDPTVQRDEH